jgi:hypothetical protein
MAVVGSRLPETEGESSQGLSVNLYGGDRLVRYTPIDDSLSVAARLDASLVPPDRSVCEVALRRSLGNWVFHVPATIAVLWLSTVIADLAVVLSVMLGALILTSAIPALAAVVLAVPDVLTRPLTRKGRAGYLWFLGATAFSVLDCLVYGTCLFLLARAGGFAIRLPL